MCVVDSIVDPLSPKKCVRAKKGVSDWHGFFWELGAYHYVRTRRCACVFGRDVKLSFVDKEEF